ncbi:hydroxymethylglutaryl-CoA lyase [Candidatus Spongiihabitans sp.]|uniref:hydroxymethylglutaryl-CoA lyase n=1 Tax=Candidatus Spongiihabitans sp. TaxID=3101308 RepID=UPI003C7A41A9
MLPQRVTIVEVGPRDGLQNESTTLSKDVRVELIRRLMDCGLTHIEAGSFVHPQRVPQMAGTDAVLAELPLDGDIHFPVLVPNQAGLEKALAAGAKEIAIFAAASETFSQKNINCSIAESMRRFMPVAEQAHRHGVKVRGYISCVMGCPYEGIIEVNAVVAVARRLIDLGCYEISLGDTIGAGSPLMTQRMIESLANDLEINRLAVHFHDTYGQALTNIYAALQLGVSVIDSSVAGLGGCPYAHGVSGKGASGNVASEDVVHLLNGLGIAHGVNLDKLVDTGRYICAQLDRPVMSRVNLAMS